MRWIALKLAETMQQFHSEISDKISASLSHIILQGS